MKDSGILTRQQWAEQARGKNAMTFEMPLRKIVRTEVVVKDVNPETGMHDIGFVISTASIDREGDIINPDGWDLENYKQNPVVLWAHDYWTPPIGKALDVSIKDGALVATDRFTPEDINPFGAMIYRMIKGGYLKATSVGFKPIEWTFNEEHRGYDFLRAELLEHSVVPVPANPEALVMASAAGIDLRPMREWVARFLDHDQSVEKFALVPRSMAEAAWKNLSGVDATGRVPSVTSGYFYRIGDSGAQSADCVGVSTSGGTSVETYDNTTWDPTYEVRFLGDWPKKFDDEQKRKEHEMEELLKEILEEIHSLQGEVAKLADLVQTKAPTDDAATDDEMSADELRSVVRDVVGEIMTATTGKLPG